MPQYKLLNEKKEIVTIIMYEEGSNWPIPEGHTLELIEELPKPPRKITAVSQLNFWKRFTTEERIATKSSTDPIVKDFVDMVSLSQVVSLADPDIINGVTQLELLEILADGRADEILLVQEIAP